MDEADGHHGDGRTVLIADDHDVTSRGLAEAVARTQGLTVVGRAADGLEAIALVKRLRPDCAVLDLMMPGANGLQVMIEARRWSPDTRFVVLTGSPAAGAFRELVHAGVEGLLVKNAPAEAICAAIARVAEGERVIAPEAEAILERAARAQSLTARETEVLHGIAAGLANGGIAERLGVSAKTVDSHRTSLMRKLGVNSTAALLMLAVRDGLIDARQP